MIDQPDSIQIIHNDLCCEVSPFLCCYACGAKKCADHYYRLQEHLADTHLKVLQTDDHYVTHCTITNTLCCQVTPGRLDFVQKCTHGKNPNGSTSVISKASNAG
jgi:hypothetical protein